MFCGLLQHNRSSSVAEEHSDVAALGCDVEAFGVDLCSHEENRFVHAGADKLIGDRESVDKSTTSLADVESRAARETEFGLKKTAESWEIVVRRKCRTQDEIDFIRINVSIGECEFSRFKGQVTGAYFWCRPTTLSDPRAL